jgi:hypothetical protein
MTVQNIFSRRNDRLGLHCIISFITILLLGIIDNGPEVVAELLRPSVWCSLLLLSVIILFGQAIAREWFLVKYNGKHKTLFSCLIGIPLGIVLLYSIFYLLKHS